MSDWLTRTVSASPPGTAFSRYLTALAHGGGNVRDARLFAEEMKGTPQVEAAFDLLCKAAIMPGTTSDATWAAPLAITGISTDVLQLLRGLSVVGQLETRLRRVPFNTIVPRVVGPVLLGEWVGEGKPTPVASLAFDDVGPIAPTKLAIIVPITKELALASSPSAEAAVLDTVLGGLAATLDTKFLLPTIAPAPPGNPGSITYGAPAVTSTGDTAAAITADLAAMRAALTTGISPVWIMRPTTMAHVAAALGTASGLPGMLHGWPVILSGTSPAQITLLDTAGVLYADEGGFAVSLSEQVLVQMDDAPHDPVTAATVMSSFWQMNLIGVRALRWVGWLRAVEGSVVYMTVAY